jgi:hypothetical protein
MLQGRFLHYDAAFYAPEHIGYSSLAPVWRATKTAKISANHERAAPQAGPWEHGRQWPCPVQLISSGRWI